MVAERDDRQDKALSYETSVEKLVCEILTSSNYFAFVLCRASLSDTSECNKEERLGT